MDIRVSWMAHLIMQQYTEVHISTTKIQICWINRWNDYLYKNIIVSFFLH